jgi:4-amino-4-deoxy-L-arabinose transferase-like glycosyltransferase
LPIPLAFAAPSSLSIPYFIGIIVIAIVFIALLLAFPSLRRYRKKRSLLVYCIFALLVVLLFSQINDVYKQAIVNFGLDNNGSTRAYLGENNTISLYSQNMGNKAVDFYVILKAQNASFPTSSGQDYIQLNNKTVKVFFSLSESALPQDNDKKPVFFRIDENVTGFLFSTSLESKGYQKPLYISTANTEIFVWNSTENCFMLNSTSGFT